MLGGKQTDHRVLYWTQSVQCLTHSTGGLSILVPREGLGQPNPSLHTLTMDRRGLEQTAIPLSVDISMFCEEPGMNMDVTVSSRPSTFGWVLQRFSMHTDLSHSSTADSTGGHCVVCGKVEKGTRMGAKILESSLLLFHKPAV